MASALVFGASGQIGQALVSGLLRDGWQVDAISRAPRQAVSGLNWIQADLCQPTGLPLDVDAVFSCGPLDHFSTWYVGAAGLRARVVAFGSTSVEVKRDSSDPHERALAARLATAEARLFESARARGAAASVLRPTLVYGVARDMTLTRIAQLARRAGFFVLPRSACGMRQPVHVQDLADAAQAVLDSDRTHGRAYALPGGETLAYAQMVERTLAALQPPARLIPIPTVLFKAALAGAHALGRMQGLSDAAFTRMGEDLVFDAAPARRDFGYAPRNFEPHASMFSL